MMHSEPKPILQSSKAEAAHADLVQQQVLSPSADSDAALSVTSGVSSERPASGSAVYCHGA